MIADLVPPHNNVGVAVAGNYESDNDDLICPLCNFPSGWSSVLWINNIPEIGLYCNNCHSSFYESDFYNG